MKLSIITLTYNKLEYTKKFIESLYKYTKDFELIIVDNGSTDGTVEYLKTIPNIKFIENKENQGFSKGNNQGIEIAEGEFIGFLNNDILLYPKWFEEVQRVFQNENAAFVSPRELRPNFIPTNEKKYIKYFQKKLFKDSYEKTFDDCVFSCVITKRCILDEIGAFDENYSPAFFEDNDLKIRAINKNHGIFVVNSVCFYHFGSVTSSKMNSGFEKNRKYYYSKFPIAEYIELTGSEKFSLQRQLKLYNIFPVNILVQFLLTCTKIKNRILKILKGRA